MNILRKVWLAAGLTGLIAGSLCAVARNSFAAPQAPSGADVPVVKGDAGPCSADFSVLDAAGKGVYNAKIDVHIRYGFGGFHHLDATVGTNSEGKARMEGLPEQIKRTAEFQVSHGPQSKSVAYDPQADCHPQVKVVLGDK